MPPIRPLWEFEKVNPRNVRRDPFEAAFFAGEEESEEVYGRTDSLVREVLQNSLDARIDERPAEVRFAISLPSQRLALDIASRYLHGLPEHLEVMENEIVNARSGTPPMTWLAIEDFNTRGLTGDPARTSDPSEDAEREAFYWFWRNIGRSGKGGTDRGRWGLGKTVFPAASAINALFGLTIRHDDERRLLMGQAVTRAHTLNSVDYQPEAFFHDNRVGDGVQMPCEDPAWLSQFVDDFSLKRRGGQPGLSVVVPYPFSRLKAKELLRSVVVHYFLAIIRGELIVRVEGPDCPETVLNRDTIRMVTDGIEWDNRRRAQKKHAAPPFDLVEWAIETKKTDIRSLNLAGRTRVPEWTDELFPTGLREQLRGELSAGQRICARVPMTVELKQGVFQETAFDVFIERDANLDRGEDYFVRGGMTIAGVSTLGSTRGYRGLVFVDDPILSALLGDTEGPAHNDWSTGESRPDRTYAKWKRRVGFVKNSLQKLIGLLAPPPVGLDIDLLRDIFWLPEEGEGIPSETKGRRSKKKHAPPPPPPPPPPPSPKPYRITWSTGGFKVASTGDGVAPSRITVQAAYDIDDGNPLRNWSPFDFAFEKAPITVSAEGGQFEVKAGNRLEFVPDGNDFEIQAIGFDLARDVYVSVTATQGEDA